MNYTGNSVFIAYPHCDHQLMPKPFFQEQENQPSIVNRLVHFVRSKIAATTGWFTESSLEWKQNRQLRLEHRQMQRERGRRPKWPGGFADKFYMFMDYDPTDAESGETGRPSVLGALTQWSYRVLWTRRIEIFGGILIIVVGTFCYSAVSQSNKEKPDSTSRSQEIQPESFDVTAR